MEKKYGSYAKAKITMIVQNTKGTRVYTKRFNALDIDVIQSNTEMMGKADNYILVREFVLLNEITRPNYNKRRVLLSILKGDYKIW